MTFTETEAVPGTGSQSNISRWGDYSKTSVDPVNDSVFWHTNEYMTNSWKTRIVSFTFGPPKTPEISAGPDTTICSDNIYDTQAASGKYFMSVEWESDGDGRFLPSNNTLHTDYMRGSGDIENGQVTLSVTATGYGDTGQAYDEMILSIQSLPRSYAGNDTTICHDDVLLLSGAVENANSSEWKTEGDGFFDDPFSLEATYTPGSQDIENGSVKLRLFGYAIEPCIQSYNDQLNVTIDQCVGVDSFDTEPIVKIAPNPVSSELTIEIENSSYASQVLITDARGKVLFSTSADAGSAKDLSIDMSGFSNGVYMVKIVTGEHIHVEKVIKR